MASSLISEASKLYNSFSEALSKTLSPALQENLNQLSATLDRYLPESITDNLPNCNILLLSLLLPIFLFFSMSSWGQRFWPASGRYSPFAAHGGPPRVSDADYSYIADDDMAGTSPHNSTYALHGHHHHHVPRAESTNTLAPDILVLRHKGTFYPLHFPAFSIAEGDLSVADLRRCAARETGCNDERRVKLLYKGKALKDDRRACRDEGLKQNSEIMCIVSASPDTYHEGGQRIDDGMSTSESGDDDDPYEDERDIRADVDDTIVGRGERRRRKGHRSGKRRKARGGNNSQTTSPRGSGYLHPEPSHAHHHSREPSPIRTSTTNIPPQPSATPTPRPTSAPDSPEGKLNAISRTFHNTFVPQCVQYMSNPPFVKKDRDFEYKKLSEGILAQVILKLDEVQSEDAAVKARRKELVKETQQMLSRLDEVGKAV